MAYSTGVATTMADLLTALTTAAVANGWTWADSILFSGDCHVRLTAAAASIEALAGLGKAGSTITSPAPDTTFLRAVHVAHPIVFPAIYHLFARAEEVYCLINFSTSYYIALGFGQSAIAGGPGTGVWVAGTAFTATGNDAYGNSAMKWVVDGDGTILGDWYSGANNGGRTGLFIVNSDGGFGGGAGCYVHHGLPGWSGRYGDLPRTFGGIKQLNALDNPAVNWSQQTMLVPIQPWVDRGSSKVSIVADLLHARYVRLDNLEPGDAITLGPDTWHVFPVYRKDAAARNGFNEHSGTYGYAFRE